MKEPVKLKNDYITNKELAKKEMTLSEYKLMREGKLKIGGLSNMARNMDLIMSADERYNSITVLTEVPFSDSVDGVIDIAYDSNKQSIVALDPNKSRDNIRLTTERYNILKEAGIINEDGSQTKAQKAIFDIDKDHMLSKDLDLILNVVGSKEILNNRLESVKATGARNLEKSDGVSKEEIEKDLKQGEVKEKDSPSKEEQVENSLNKTEGKTIGGKRVIKLIEIESKEKASDITKDTVEDYDGTLYLVQLEDNQYRVVTDKGDGNFEERQDYSVNELGKTLNNEYNQVLVRPRDIEIGNDTGYNALNPNDQVVTFRNSTGNESLENGNSEHVEIGLDGSVKKFDVLDESSGIVIVDDSTGLKEPYIANFGGKEKLVTTQGKLDEMTGADENPDKANKIQNDIKEGNISGQNHMLYLKDLVRKRQEIINELNKGEDADLDKIDELSKDISELSSNSKGISIDTSDIKDKTKEIEKLKEEKAKEEPAKEDDEEQRTIHDAAKRYY